MYLARALKGFLVVTACLALAACGGSGSSSDTTAAPATDPPATDAPTTDAPTTDAPTTDAPTTVPEPVAAIAMSDTGYSIEWSNLAATPFFGQPAGSDPFFHIHTDPATDGFFLSFEMYTVYGPGWTGQLGTFDIDCGANGICVHLDPDGTGPIGDLGADFLATGSVTINQLDVDGYDIVVDELVFSDGTTIAGLHLVG